MGCWLVRRRSVHWPVQCGAGGHHCFLSHSVVKRSGGGQRRVFFTPVTAISVTELGYVDCGFSVGHDVGLYDVLDLDSAASTMVTGS